MIKQLKILFLITLLMLLVGCDLFDDEEVIKPAKLTAFQQQLFLKVIWTNKNDGGAGDEYLKLTPAVVEQKIFTVSYKGRVKAVNINSGRNIWEVNTNLPLRSGVAADNSNIYIGTDAGRIIALRQSDGKMVWQASFPSSVLAIPCVAKGKVIAKGIGGQLLAFDAATGKQLWSYAEEEPGLILRGSSAPRIAGNLVINGFADGQLVALNIQTGKVEWKQAIAEPTGSATVDRMTDIDADPVIADRTIYTAAYQGHIAAVNLNGRILWQKELSAYSDIAVGTNAIYTSDSQGLLYAFNRKTGEVLWKQAALTGRNLSAPVLYHGNLIVGDVDGYVHCLATKDGHFLARLRVDKSEIIAPPLVVDDSLFVMSKSGKLVKIK